MKKYAFAIVFALVAATTSGIALAAPQPAPAVLTHGATNPVAWGLKSLQWTTFYVSTDTTSSWATVEVLSSTGVVARIYDGALSARPTDAKGRKTFPIWNGRGLSGAYLPTGNYQYRIKLKAGAQTTTVTGPIAVSRNRWTLTGDGQRYLVAAPIQVYLSASTAQAEDIAWFAYFRLNDNGSLIASRDYKVRSGSPIVAQRVAVLPNGVAQMTDWSTGMTTGPGTVSVLVVQ